MTFQVFTKWLIDVVAAVHRHSEYSTYTVRLKCQIAHRKKELHFHTITIGEISLVLCKWCFLDYCQANKTNGITWLKIQPEDKLHFAPLFHWQKIKRKMTRLSPTTNRHLWFPKKITDQEQTRKHTLSVMNVSVLWHQCCFRNFAFLFELKL